jgi:hypothetical protein
MSKKIFVFFLLLSFSFCAFSQIGNNNGKYDTVINMSFHILQNLYKGNVKVVKSQFKETDFQTKDEFNNFLGKDNLKWLKQTIDVFGITPKSEIDISEWRVKSGGEYITSINVTFYLKPKNSPFSMINDHVSLSFKKQGNTLFLNGLMMFKKENYIMVKNIIDNIPQN